jgi:hypothetical protein
MEGYLSERGGSGRIIFITTKAENGQLVFDNSAGVIGVHSEIGLLSIETEQTPHHQGISVLCSCLSTVDKVLRHFLVPHKRPHDTTYFRKLHFRPVVANHERIYFGCPSTAVNLQHIVLIHRYKNHEW